MKGIFQLLHVSLLSTYVDWKVVPFSPETAKTLTVGPRWQTRKSPLPIRDRWTLGSPTMTRILHALILLLAGIANGQLLNGTFVSLGEAEVEHLTTAQMESYFNELQSNGMTTIVILATRVPKSGCPYTWQDYGWLPGLPNKLNAILTKAELRGMAVYVGLASSGACGFWTDASLAASITADTTTILLPIASGRTSFKGWYLPDEPPFDKNDAIWAIEKKFYFEVVKGIRRAETTAGSQHHPIVVSPYMKGLTNEGGCPNGSDPRWCTPGYVGARARDFQRSTNITIQAWQDSAGGGPILSQWNRGSPSPEAYYSAIRDAIGLNALWATIELFSYPDGDSGGTGSYPTSAAKLNSQLWTARPGVTSKRVSFLNQVHMSALGVTNWYGGHATRLLRSYQGYYNLGNYRRTVPASYSWVTPPSSPYGDSGEMFDTQVADPLSPTAEGWTGISSPTPEVVLDLGTAKNLQWIGISALSYPAWGIYVPSGGTVCFSDTPSFGTVICRDLPPFQPTSPTIGEHVLGNSQAFDVGRYRYVRIRMANTKGWTFLNEIELTTQF